MVNRESSLRLTLEITVEDAWMRYGRVPHEFANELWPLARPREPT